MISKEERAELRKLIEQAAVWPLPRAEGRK